MISEGFVKLSSDPCVYMLPPQHLCQKRNLKELEFSAECSSSSSKSRPSQHQQQRQPSAKRGSGLLPRDLAAQDGTPPAGLLQRHMDDFLWFGNEFMEETMGRIRVALRIGTEEVDRFMYLGAYLQTHFSVPDDETSSFEISLGQGSYVDQISEIPLSRDRLRQSDELAVTDEYESFRGGLGQIGWLATIVHLYLAFMSSALATRVNDLRVKDLAKLNKTIRLAKQNRDLRIWLRRLYQTNPWIPTILVLADSSLNNMPDSEEGFEPTDTQQGVLVVAISEVTHVEQLGTGRIPANPLANSSNKCPRKVHASFGAEAISLNTGLDSGLGVAYLADEILGWRPLKLVPPVAKILGLTDGESVITNLLGHRSTGFERRLLGYLAANRNMLRTKEIVTVAHLVGKRQYADVNTKDGSTELFLDYLYSGELDFKHPKQLFDRIVSGREQFF